MSTIGIALYYLFDILSWIIVIKSFMTWLPSGGGKFYDVLWEDVSRMDIRYYGKLKID